jgi:DNA-binding NarL/FixJ family response regulator
MNSSVTTRDQPAAANRPWKVLLVDDHPVVRDGLAQRIDMEPDLSVCATCESVSSALREVTEHHPDLAVVDLSLPNGHGLDLIKEIHARFPDVRLLVFSMHDEQTYGERALLSGAQGYVMKDESPDEVLAAIRKVLSGRISISPHLSARLAEAAVSTGGSRNRKLPMDRLSNRELEVLEWMGQGKSVKAIAERLDRSAKTIETYRQRLKDKLHIQSNSELIAHAARWVQEHGSHAASPRQRKPRAHKSKGQA